MKTRTIPGTDLRVSAVGLGGWALGGEHWGDDVDDDAARAAVHAALDVGITLFDTAPLYGRGHADAILREALGPRIREVVVATKVGPRYEGDHPVSDLSPANLRRDVEASLRRLGVEALDLAQIHWPCEVGTPLEASLEALVALREEGKIRHLGLCNYGPEALERARALAPIVTLQTPLSLIRREYEGGVSDAVARTGVGVLAYEPLARGLLTGKYRALPRFGPTDMRRRDPRFWAAGFSQIAPTVERLRRAAAQLNTTPAALAIAWAATRPGVLAALAGAKRPAQVRENAEAGRLLERPGARALLDRVGDAVAR
ncbi:MAG TPA: aldo/keto reductase [Sandaracinaceae bacterium LLY-WYZ-13_1]|nr:aldo/keto reductase [Sandaracinaceae bacterium LLY-WYZ-13_1]